MKHLRNTVAAIAVACSLAGMAADEAQAQSAILGNEQVQLYTESPYYEYWYNVRNYYLIQAEELEKIGIAPGSILTSLAFEKITTSIFGANRQYQIRMKETDEKELESYSTAADNKEWVTVWEQASWNIPSVPTPPPGETRPWVVHEFSEPFRWQGRNIKIETCSWRTGYTYFQSTYGSYTKHISTLYSYGDVSPTVCNTANYPYGYAYGTTVRPNMRFAYLAGGIEASFPEDIDPRRILRSGSVYSSLPERPYVDFRTAGAGTITYKIVGPLPATNEIYVARKNGSTDIPISGSGVQRLAFDEATGPAAGSFGALDLRNTAGGSYRVVASYTSSATGRRDWTKDFIIAVDNDISTRDIVAPSSNAAPRFFKYPQNVDAPVSVRYQNVGLNTIASFEATVSITAPNGSVWTRKDTVRNLSMATGGEVTIDFPAYTQTNQVGLYSVQACAKLLRIRNSNGVEVAVNESDVSKGNDCIPKQGESYTFEVQYETEVAAEAIVTPTSTIAECANNPLKMVGRFRNVGINDLSDVPVRMRVYRLPNLTTPVYDNRVIADALPTGGQFVDVGFAPFIPTSGGQYQAVLFSDYAAGVDPVQSNDTVKTVFSINNQLSGTYTIGQGGNYLTIGAAVDALYDCGVSGPIVFELTDAEYTVGSAGAPFALDLTSRIVGVNETNTISFRPSKSRETLGRSVKINLLSSSGKGIVFGQNYLPQRPFSVQGSFPSKENAVSAGFITFDGGEKKSIVFSMQSAAPHRAPIYMGRGSSNIAIRNCWIENSSASTPSYATSLPRQTANSGLSFVYEPDVRIVSNQPVTYSAGIVNRNTVPVNDRTGNNDEKLDTLVNTNNVIEGNIISGFGYGVVTLGDGVLYSTRAAALRPYYNVGTKIVGNRIENVARAGVYAGYEDGIEVRGNYITGVGTPAGYTGIASGVMLGYSGERYHNVNARISGNEITNVVSASYASGIAVTLNANRFQGDGTLITFPSGNTDNRTWNNIVRGVNGTATTARVAGIHYLTGRFVNGSGVVDMNRAQFDDVWTAGDKVYNNTIVLAPGSVSLSNGMVVGIGFEQSRAASVENNAIALQYPSVSGNAVQSFLLWHGAVTGNNGIQSNNNAFWTPSTNGVPNSAFAMLVETTPSNEQVAVSDMNRFRTLSQWRALVKQDQHSVFGDFVSDHAVVDGKLRLKSNPTPIGSILNNRGTRLESVVTDLDGKVRGESQQLYDIGAVEFNGRFYLNDIESEEITQPRAYRALSGAAADAEHVMGQPLNVIKANIRNSGSLPQTNVELVAEVFIEQANGQYSAVAAASATKRVSLLDGQRQEVEFALNNFTPKTYAELANYTVPSRFAAMSQNVTPKYRVVVRSANDQNSSNNIFSKEVRYWVKRSKTGIVVSVSGTSGAIGSSFDLATRLNSDTLLGAMRQLQWSYSNGDYDVIDRGAWESEAFDYSPYSFVFWSQGRSSTGSGLSRTQREDIRRYLASGSIQSKKNLLLASEEIARAHTVANAVNDGFFVNRVLRGRLVTTPQNTPKAPSYHNFQIEGVRVASTYRELVKETGVTFNGYPDISPRPALLQMYSDNETEGLAQPAYKYLSLDAGVTVNTMGTAVSAPMHNIVYYGMDWRHAGRMVGDDQSGAQRMLLGALDYFKSNGGVVLPVELSSFAAEKASDRSVSVRWVTSSEQNTDRFEVERSEDGTTYRSVGSVAAAGTSTETRVYGHVDSDIRPVVYQYRLRMIDRDGSEAYSRSVEVDMRDAENVGALVSPNPSTGDYATVSYRTSLTGDVSLRIVGTDGREVVTESLGRLTSGDHEYRLGTVGLSSGSYVVRISVDGKEQGTTILKVVK